MTQKQFEEKVSYRLIVGEIGNNQGHIVATAAKTERGAKIALGHALSEYYGDGWGWVEINYNENDPNTWQVINE